MGTTSARSAEFVPTLEAAFRAGGVHVIAVPIDYSENKRVLVDELRDRMPPLALAQVSDHQSRDLVYEQPRGPAREGFGPMQHARVG